MTVQQLENVLRVTPFAPFTIHLADGRALDVPGAEYLSYSPSGRTVIVWRRDESFTLFDLFSVTRLEVRPIRSSS